MILYSLVIIFALLFNALTYEMLFSSFFAFLLLIINTIKFLLESHFIALNTQYLPILLIQVFKFLKIILLNISFKIALFLK